MHFEGVLERFQVDGGEQNVFVIVIDVYIHTIRKIASKYNVQAVSSATCKLSKLCAMTKINGGSALYEA